jgi:hypothetical protein
MADFDLFNGDADGIFSLLQLRQLEPRPKAELITGVKRDIRLFQRITRRVQAKDRVTALDISLAKNHTALTHILHVGATVFYCDHHQTGDIPQSAHLTLITDEAKISCTAFLIDGYLGHKKTGWAICGAYGDNFPTLANAMAARAGLSLPLGRLRELGELVNYNAYGITLNDLHFHPADLYKILLSYPDPIAFLDDHHPAFQTLRDGYREDWDMAQNAREIDLSDAGQILSLPAKPASNRISGLFGNALVDEDPDKAFAILTELTPEDGPAFRVSIRAPRSRKTRPADDLASQFGGGGRAAAAGINSLPASDLARFVTAFRQHFKAS